MPRTNAIKVSCMWALAMVGCSTPAQAPVQAESAVSTLRKPIQIHGHRGGRGLAPENTLPSFEAALDLEVDVLELDLHFSADNVPVIWHDPYVRNKKCNPGDSAVMPSHDYEAGAAIRSLASEELQQLDCSKNPDSERFPEQVASPGQISGADYGIVPLNRLFNFVESYAASPTKSPSQRANATRIRFNIETKRDPDHPEFIGDEFDGKSAGPFEATLVALIQRHELTDRVIIQSFDHRSLWAVHALNSDLKLAALTRSVPDFLSLAHQGASVWSPRHTLVTAASLAQAHDAGLEVIPWTVNDVDRAQELKMLGVDGIITDHPDRIRR